MVHPGQTKCNMCWCVWEWKCLPKRILWFASSLEQACSTCVSFGFFTMFVLFRETERLWENWLITKTAFHSPRCDMSCAHLVGAARSRHTIQKNVKQWMVLFNLMLTDGTCCFKATCVMRENVFMLIPCATWCDLWDLRLSWTCAAHHLLDDTKGKWNPCVLEWGWLKVIHMEGPAGNASLLA